MNWIKSKCLLLPSCELKPRQLLMEDNKLRIATSLKNDCLNSQTHGQHLYFTCDEEIKEGDWCINANNTIVQYRQLFRDKKVCKKIIATTDKSLKIHTFYEVEGNQQVCLPEPSKEFLEVYIKAYNEGKLIEDVLIEQEDFGEEDWEGDNYSGQPVWKEDWKIKIKPDNTITIKKVKDSWSREEVMDLLYNFANSEEVAYIMDGYYSGCQDNTVKTYIERINL